MRFGERVARLIFVRLCYWFEIRSCAAGFDLLRTLMEPDRLKTVLLGIRV
jgi:hypothetical protein